ncbi:MAG: hypothetical protein WC700_18025 [Gemmatimonadaceae bacterium]|jgi:hypothetical protein
MKKTEIEIGQVYLAKVSGEVQRVKITGVCTYGGWLARNLATGREIRIKTAARLRPDLIVYRAA